MIAQFASRPMWIGGSDWCLAKSGCFIDAVLSSIAWSTIQGMGLSLSTPEVFQPHVHSQSYLSLGESEIVKSTSQFSPNTNYRSFRSLDPENYLLFLTVAFHDMILGFISFDGAEMEFLFTKYLFIYPSFLSQRHEFYCQKLVSQRCGCNKMLTGRLQRGTTPKWA